MAKIMVVLAPVSKAIEVAKKLAEDLYKRDSNSSESLTVEQYVEKHVKIVNSFQEASSLPDDVVFVMNPKDEAPRLSNLLIQKYDKESENAHTFHLNVDKGEFNEASNFASQCFFYHKEIEKIDVTHKHYITTYVGEYDLLADKVVTLLKDIRVEEIPPVVEENIIQEEESMSEENQKPEEVDELVNTQPPSDEQIKAETDSPVDAIFEETDADRKIIVNNDPDPEPFKPVDHKAVEQKETPLVDEGASIQKEEKVEVEPIKADDEFDFDPIAAAAEASAELALQEEVKHEVKVEEKKEEPVQNAGMLKSLEDPTLPKVDRTVEVSTKLFSDVETPKDNYLMDFGGSLKTFQRLQGIVENKIEWSVQNRRAPKLTPLEEGVMEYSRDVVANEEYAKVSYVDGARWSGYIDAPTAKVPLIVPFRNPQYGDAKYSGPDAVALLKNRMKIGCKLGQFLPHSGIYVVINSPSDEDVLNALSIINNNRVEALRSSSGILLGNSNFYLYRQIMNLFIDNISDCSLAGWNKEQLLKVIDERDINIIAALLMASIYPDGYEYRQLCGQVQEDNTTCSHVTTKTVDLRRLIFVDNSRLSETQKVVAASGLAQRSLNEVQTYQQTNYIGYKKAYEITPGISFVYKAQNVDTVIEAGEKWIREIEAVVDSIITFNDDDDTRNTMIRQRIGLTRIREYSHWVSEIWTDNEDNAITDRAAINELLSSLSRNQEVLDRVGETLSEFQRLSQVAIVAIPRVECPVCHKTSTKDLEISPHLIPQDAVSRFFTLALQRLS